MWRKYALMLFDVIFHHHGRRDRAGPIPSCDFQTQIVDRVADAVHDLCEATQFRRIVLDNLIHLRSFEDVSITPHALDELIVRIIRQPFGHYAHKAILKETPYTPKANREVRG